MRTRLTRRYARFVELRYKARRIHGYRASPPRSGQATADSAVRGSNYRTAPSQRDGMREATRRRPAPADGPDRNLGEPA
jgi:hypothetical protein